MSVKKPLVLGADGLPQQLQAGDTVGAIETGQVSQTSDAIFIAGQAVYTTTDDHVDKAKADASGTVPCIGLAMTAIGSGLAVQIQTNGVLTLTTGEWDALCGTTGGLTAGARYYLSAATAGLLTATPPSTVGQYVQPVIKALSTTEAVINPGVEILL